MNKGIKAALRFVNSRADRIKVIAFLVKLDTGHEVHWNIEAKPPEILALACLLIESIAKALGRSPDNIIAMISQGLHECPVDVEVEDEVAD